MKEVITQTYPENKVVSNKCNDGKVYLMDVNGELSILLNKTWGDADYAWFCLDSAFTSGNQYCADKPETLRAAIDYQLALENRKIYEFNSLVEAMKYFIEQESQKF